MKIFFDIERFSVMEKKKTGAYMGVSKMFVLWMLGVPIVGIIILKLLGII